MSIWCGHDGSFNDDDGDGPADLSGLDDEIVVGWQDPFSDWRGNLFYGMGQYGVYTVTDPWEPADFPAVLYPDENDPAYVVPVGGLEELYAHPPEPPETSQQPESPGSTPSAPSTPGLPHFGPPPGQRHRTSPRGAGGTSRPSTMARGIPAPRRPTSSRAPAPAPHAPPSGPAHNRQPPRQRHGSVVHGIATGFDYPLTDDGGHLLMDPHPSHQEWPWPMTYGDPVMTGWETPLTDLEGKLLSGPGQYGVFTMTNPYDHRTFNSVDLDSEKLIGDPFYFYTGADDAGQDLGSGIGSALGSASGNDAGAWGSAGKDIASSIESGSDSGNWGAAIASIAAATAKVAVPAIVKAATSSSKPAASTPAPTATTPAATATPSATAPQLARSSDPRHRAMIKLMTQMRMLAQRYGVAIPPPKHAGATPAQLQQFMQSVAPQGGS
jgi:hypothetical protein